MLTTTSTQPRYIVTVVNGKARRSRDQVALRAQILDLLAREPLTMKRIITTLASAQCTIDAALRSLLDEGKIERFRAMSVRRRLDEFWCLAGRAPHASIARYNAAEILAAFQLAASNQLGVK